MTKIADASTKVLIPKVQHYGANSTLLSEGLNGVSNTLITNKSPAASNANKNDLVKHISEGIENINIQKQNFSNVYGPHQTKSPHVAAGTDKSEECREELPSSHTFYTEKLNTALEDVRNGSSKKNSHVDKALKRYYTDTNQSDTARKRFEFF